jgi:hypothetical protein
MTEEDSASILLEEKGLPIWTTAQADFFVPPASSRRILCSVSGLRESGKMPANVTIYGLCILNGGFRI